MSSPSIQIAKQNRFEEEPKAWRTVRMHGLPTENSIWQSEMKRKVVAGGVALAHTIRHVYSIPRKIEENPINYRCGFPSGKLAHRVKGIVNIEISSLQSPGTQGEHNDYISHQ